jgi:hypothetical protein
MNVKVFKSQMATGDNPRQVCKMVVERMTAMQHRESEAQVVILDNNVRGIDPLRHGRA